MTCPYCGGAMEPGIIQSPQEINWHPGLRKRAVNAAFLHEDSLVLSKRNFWSGSAVKAYLCRRCEKLIIDHSDEASDVNHL